MIRSFIVLLLLAVFFLSGMLYGIDQGNQEGPPADPNEQLETEVGEGNIFPSDNNTAEANEEILEAVEQQNFTQQTASFLEAGVKGIYDVIVQMLYLIAQLFF